MDGAVPEILWLIPVIAVVGWSAILSLIARLSGWTSLADLYRDDAGPSADRRGFQSVRIGFGDWRAANYNNCITVSADPQSLKLAPFFLFRPFHPALSIPLYDLGAEPGPGGGLVLHVARAPGVRIEMPGGLSAWILERTAGAIRPR